MPHCGITFAEGATSDPRDYKVDFSKLERTLPEYRLSYTLRKGTVELLENYRRYMPRDCLTSDRFYRLKTLKRKLEANEVPPYFHVAERPVGRALKP